MDETIKELTLLLRYLTSWKEDAGLTKVHRSWKGYPYFIFLFRYAEPTEI